MHSLVKDNHMLAEMTRALDAGVGQSDRKRKGRRHDQKDRMSKNQDENGNLATVLRTDMLVK